MIIIVHTAARDRVHATHWDAQWPDIGGYYPDAEFACAQIDGDLAPGDELPSEIEWVRPFTPEVPPT